MNESETLYRRRWILFGHGAPIWWRWCHSWHCSLTNSHRPRGLKTSLFIPDLLESIQHPTQNQMERCRVVVCSRHLFVYFYQRVESNGNDSYRLLLILFLLIQFEMWKTGAGTVAVYVRWHATSEPRSKRRNYYELHKLVDELLSISEWVADWTAKNTNSVTDKQRKVKTSIRISRLLSSRRGH